MGKTNSMFYSLGIIMILLGISIFISDTWNFRGSVIELSKNNINVIFGSFLIIYGILVIYSKIRSKDNAKKFIEYSKCPKCKKIFTYLALNQGKCKKCKDIDTIDLDEYFIKFPNDKYKE